MTRYNDDDTYRTASFGLVPPAKLPQEAQPLFLLHCGQIGSEGEQEDWDCEADSGKRVDEFTALHPGQTIKLYAAAALEAAKQEGHREAIEQLSDPQVVHAAMLRGTIAKISMLQCAHTHGEQAVADYRALIEKGKQP